MPSPVYIICAHDIVENKATNVVSIFNVVEKITASRAQAGESVPLPHVTLLKAIAVWRKEEGDEGQEFESEMTVRAGDEELGRATSVFQFDATAGLHRIILTFPVMLAVQEDGVVTVRSRIRRADNGDWIEQSYPIAWEFIQAEPAANQPDE